MSVTDRVIEVNTLQEQEEAVRDREWVIHMFTSSRCGHCAKAEPYVMKKLEEYPNTYIIWTDIMKTKAVPANLKAFPTFVLYHNGEPVDQLIGFKIPLLNAMLEETS